MKTKPTNWDTGKNSPNHGYVTVLNCTLPDGTVATYGMNDLMSLTGSWSLYADTYDIGNTVMNQVEFTLDIARKEGIAPQTLDINDYFPKMTKVEVVTQIMVGSTSYGTCPMGVYYTDKPNYDYESGIVNITAYDPMFLANVTPYAEGSVVSVWQHPTLRQVATHLVTGTDISGVIESNSGGISSFRGETALVLEDATQVPDDIYMDSIPYGYTVREILGEIALATCGNWTIVTGQSPSLRLVSKLPS